MSFKKKYDLVCVGGGIMSATLALMAKVLDPKMEILILERLDTVAKESSSAWNNAGTGHSALCELNYCPEEENGEINIEKAVEICKQFEISKQFWAYLVEEGMLNNPETFITSVPHHSWVAGADNVDYLERRFEAFKKHYMFDSIEFTKSIETMKKWFPLMMQNRSEDEIMAASRIDRGTEVNFGELTTTLCHILETKYDTPVHCNQEVLDIDPDPDKDWTVKIKKLKTKKKKAKKLKNKKLKSKKKYKVDAKHVFIGAGGASLLLLQKVEIKEKAGYGGFPVSGEWLVCKNEAIIEQHHAKVYSKAGPNDPPMSTPHLDTRYINGKRELLFGPFAGFSPKFLKEGSNLDLFKSIKFKNISPLLGAFWHNLPLTKYLIEQVAMSHKDRVNELRKFVVDADIDDWELMHAGQRVQIIKKDAFEGGKLQFGTEVISSKNGSITCLLGASPGASTAPAIMLSVLEQAFPELMQSEKGKAILDVMVPFHNNELNKTFFNEQLDKVKSVLNV